MRLTWLLALALGTTACADEDHASASPSSQRDALPGEPADANDRGDASGADDAGPHTEADAAPGPLSLPPEVVAEQTRVAGLVAAAMEQDADALLAANAVPFRNRLGYDPLDAQNLEVIQASPFALDVDELAALGRDGFVITARQPLGSFIAGYERIYNADLPVHITADSLLHALHRSYDTLLLSVEAQALAPGVGALLDHLLARLDAGAADAWGAETVSDLRLYLLVARRLLASQDLEPPSPQAEEIVRLVDAAEAAEGPATVTLFGVERVVDFSQFEPRGHYAEGGATLTNYFRVMMWLGRVDLRLVENTPGGGQRLNRRGVAATLALRVLMDAEARSQWQRVEDVLAAFVGPQDAVTLDRLDALQGALDLPSDDLAGLGAKADEDLVLALQSGGFDVQRIRGQFLNGRAGEPAALPVSVTIFGQRYIVDSHVLSNVVWDSVQVPDHPLRMMPDPLDAAFAALGNDQAVALLEPALRTYGYAGHLGAMRALTDDLPAAFWGANLYSGWLAAIRALSPDHAVAADPTGQGFPALLGTEAWGRRMLNTQLGAWTELRHDNLLYAKPSYTGGNGCDYPDGYVEPVPAFYAALKALAERGAAVTEGPLAELSPQVAASIQSWWLLLYQVSDMLGLLAEQQRTGQPFTPEQVLWLEQAVDIAPDAYDGYVVGGWYAALLRDPLITLDPYASDRLVVDIHTQPTDEGGAPVGRVLHLGTGDVRLMVSTVESCNGPRAYVGPVYSVHTETTQGFERLNDRGWSAKIDAEPPAELPWLLDLVVR